MKAPTAFGEAVEREDAGAGRDGELVGQQRVVGRAARWPGPTPMPDRMMHSTQTNMARPVPNEKRANTVAPMSMSRTRLRLSASWAIGTVSDSPSSAAIATSERMPALLMWKDVADVRDQQTERRRGPSRRPSLRPKRMARA